MIDHGLKPTRFYKNRVILASAVCAVILGYLLALYLQPIKTDTPTQVKNIFLWPNLTRSVQQDDGPDLIIFKSLGPIFSSFSLGCWSVESYSGSGPGCIVLNYNGEPGIVELKIPNNLVGQISLWDKWIVSVDSSNHKSLPFQRISKDNSYTVLRIDVPKGDHDVFIIGGITVPPISPLIIYTCAFAAMLWVPTLLLSNLIVGGIDTLSLKISRAKR